MLSLPRQEKERSAIVQPVTAPINHAGIRLAVNEKVNEVHPIDPSPALLSGWPAVSILKDDRHHALIIVL
jgi:hypothetical protein